MGLQLTVFFQAIIFITVITISIRLVMAVFRMAKSLEVIDESLKKMSKQSNAQIPTEEKRL